MFGVNSGFCLGCDKWLGHDAVIIGARALGFSFQCRHLSVSMLALERSGAGTSFSAGTLVFQCWHLSISVLALWHSIKCFSAGTLAQEGKRIFAFESFSAGTQSLRVFEGVFQCWHSGTHRFSI